MRPVVMFGTGNTASTVAYYLLRWQITEIAAFCVDDRIPGDERYMDRAVVSLDELVNRYPPSSCDAFVAVGYQRLNALRREKTDLLRTMGYNLISVVNPDAPRELQHGQNCFIVPDDRLLEPFLEIGNNTFIWNGASISHFTRLQDDVWVSNNATVGGECDIGSGTFVGFGAIVNNKLTVGRKSLIGTGTVVTRDLPEESFLLSPSTPPSQMKSSIGCGMLR